MSKIKPERARAAEHFSSFGGFGGGLMHNEKKASIISNFRIASDGSLKKRGGYKLYHTFPDTVRAFWEGTLNAKSYLFAVCGNGIYIVDEFATTPQSIDTIDSTEGRVRFFEYEKTLYLATGNNLRYFYPATRSFPKVTPYVPLYGYHWDPTSLGTVNEPFNLLTNNIRVNYSNPSSGLSFRLPFACRSIIGVRVNGAEVTDYTFQSMTNMLTLSESSTGYSVEIAMEPVILNQNDDVQTATNAAVYPGQHHNTLCLFGTDDGYRIYPSSYVSQGNLYGCQVFYPKSTPLYFKQNNIVLAGDGENPITALCRYKDRFLVYGGLGTWEFFCPEDEKETFSIRPLLTGISCLSPDAAISVGDTPVVVNKNGIYLMHVSTSADLPPTLERISTDVEEFLTPEFITYCLAWEDRYHNEIWFRDASYINAPVLVYNLEKKLWYLFENIPATQLTDLSRGPCFSSLDALYLLDDTYMTDNGDEIYAFYQSGYFSFRRPEAKKRSLRMTVCAKTPDDSSFVTLETENASRSFELMGTDREAPDLFDFRALMGRFRFLRFRIHVGGENDSRIYAVSFYANL